jgi:hypothetical protein
LFDAAAHSFPALPPASWQCERATRPAVPMKGDVDGVTNTHLLEDFFFVVMNNSPCSWEKPYQI